ncbi:MAG: rhamnogalacturonan acetylesterase [Asticcacaulis sp.]
MKSALSPLFSRLLLSLGLVFCLTQALASQPTPSVQTSINTLKIVLVGDSTMQSQTGYGGAFCAYHVAPAVACLNLGRGGRSTSSYRAEGSWDVALGEMRNPRHSKTYVLIQFGHNDMPGKPGRSTDLKTEYPANLVAYIHETRAAGAIPVLVTPLTRRSFKDGALVDDLAPWVAAMRSVARDHSVPLVELNAVSREQTIAAGPVGSLSFAQVAPDPSLVLAARTGTSGKAAGKPEPRPAPQSGPARHRITPYFDYTHLGTEGAMRTAYAFTQALGTAVPDLAPYLIEESPR